MRGNFQSNPVWPMKRLRFRKLICAAAIGLTLCAATLGTSVLSEAAGPGEFVSGLWNKRPRLKNVSESKLNPRNWGRRIVETPVRSVRNLIPGSETVGDRADGQALESTRPDLYEDPFAVPGPESGPPMPAQKSSREPAPSPRQRREAVRRAADASDGEEQSPAVSQKEVVRSAPILPDGIRPGNSEQGQPESALLQSERKSQFTPGFDSEFQRVVQDVIRESESDRASQVAERSMVNGGEDLRGPIQAPQIPEGTVDRAVPDSLLSQDVDQLIGESRRDMASTLTVPADSQEAPLRAGPSGRQHPISLTDGTQSGDFGGHPAMLVPSGSPGDRSPESVRKSVDMRHEFSAGAVSRRAEPLSHSPGPIRPRVVSNGAPPRSVPNNARHERISYTLEEEAPVFGQVVERPALAQPQRNGRPAKRETASSAPIIDWSLDETANEAPATITIPWGFAGVLVTAVTTLFAILLLRKRQVVTVVTSGTDAARESD